MIHTSSKLLEFEAMRNLLARYIASPGGLAALERVRPSTERKELEQTLAETGEAMEYLREAARPKPAGFGAAIRLHFDGLADPAPHVAKLKIEGAVLEARDILELTDLLDRACDIRSVLMGAAERYPRLASHARRIGDFRSLLRELSGRILPDGTVADHASATLQRIRREIERLKRHIQESLERFLRAHRDDGVLQEDFITLRNDRFVVPVVSGQRKRVEGVIHGASGTGHTLFIEPFETIELNNDLVRLSEEELREVFRILADMTERLRGAGDAIQATVDALSALELLFAKARFGLDFDCVVPRFSREGRSVLSLRAARHPLLEDVLRRQRKKPVPLSLHLEGDNRTLVISGPNTGGKTVALKTVGLLALMAQAGLPVPCEDAEFPLFEQVLADIGDNQSIEQNLSTFSAHIARIWEILKSVDGRSLVLLDELGRATDPDEGGALGVAIIDQIRIWGAFSLSSTHLLAPKIYAATTPGVLNAAMSFDEETLQPTYVLRTGSPGASAGIDIAQRLGLPASIIEKARATMSSQQRDLARFLAELDARLAAVAELERSLAREKELLEQERQGLARKWEQRENARLAELERRAEAWMESFDKRASEVIESIVQSAGQRKAAQRKVSQAKREFREEFQKTVLGRSEQPAAAPAVREGAMVRLRDVRQPARVLRLLANGRIEVEAGYLRMQVNRDDILEILPQPVSAKQPMQGVHLQSGPEFLTHSREINIIGKHAEEACQEVDKFLDQAALASVARVRIVHGHGMGILKKAIAELLRNHPHVEKFYPASPEEGGSGATIAELKEE